MSENKGVGYTSMRLVLSMAAVMATVCGATAQAQTFNSGSDGSDGAFVASGPPGTVIVFDPAQYSGTHVSAGIFNFTTITVDSGVTVRFTATKLNVRRLLPGPGQRDYCGHAGTRWCEWNRRDRELVHAIGCCRRRFRRLRRRRGRKCRAAFNRRTGAGRWGAVIRQWRRRRLHGEQRSPSSRRRVGGVGVTECRHADL